MFSILDLLRSDGSIVVNKKLAKEIGLNEAIIYSELVSLHKYWEDKGQLTEGGWFFCTIENLEENTTIKKDTQNRAIGKLEKKYGLIETKRMGLPAKRYFRITDKIFDMVIENKISQNAKSDKINVPSNENAHKPLHDQISQNAKSRSRILRKQDFSKSESNNTNINNTDLEEEDIKDVFSKNPSFQILPDYLPMMQNLFNETDLKDIINGLIKYDCYEFIEKDIKAAYKKTFNNIDTIDVPALFFAKVLSNEAKKAKASKIRQTELEDQKRKAASRDTSFYYNWLKV